MAEARTLPIATEHREVTVKVEGQPVPRESQLLSVTVMKAVNRVSSARLAYVDGSAADGDFPLGNAGTFIPGQQIEIVAGAGQQSVSLFQGVVIRQAIKVRERGGAQLLVECRHKACKLTVGRKSACYFDQSDADILSAVLDRAGLAADVEETQLTHAQLVQYASSDWDFLLARAEANGKLVLTNDEGVAIRAPRASQEPACTLQFGATLLDLDAQIDARGQFDTVKSHTWDAARQSLVEKVGVEPDVPVPGNLTGQKLSAVVGLESFDLRHAALADAEAQAWADAACLKAKLSRVSGLAKCEGIGSVNPADVVRLRGVGDRYNGDVFVTGVRHEIDLVSGWRTFIQFGGVATWSAEAREISAPQAGGLLPSVSGLQIGTVVNNEDDGGEHRVRVRLPLVSAEGDGIWARVASLDAGKERGFFFRPENGDEVVVGFLDDDPRQAVILGMLHSSAKPAPLSGSNANHEKVYQSRSKLRLYFNDDEKVLRLETPSGNALTLSEKDKAVTIADQNGNSIEMTDSGIKIAAAKALTLKAGTEVKLESGTSCDVKGGTELKMQGSAGVELSSSALTKIKGSIISLN